MIIPYTVADQYKLCEPLPENVTVKVVVVTAVTEIDSGEEFEEVTNTLDDISDRTKLVKVNSCSTQQEDQEARLEILNNIPDGFFHIIIDDGSHEIQDQIGTYKNFKSKLNKDGIYIIEDIGITNSAPIEPRLLIRSLPKFKLIDMRYPGKIDNAIAIYMNNNSKHYQHHNGYYKSKHWTVAKEFTYDYIIKKQQE